MSHLFNDRLAETYYVAWMTHRPHNAHPRGGFTLLELSIVLIVIALIIGAIFVGRDLISAAQIRAQVSQIEKFNAAVNTFKLKYNNDLPGDMTSVDAATFGFVVRNVAPNTGSYHGDGDGRIYSGGPNIQGAAAGETVLFWNDLSTAGLIAGQFQGIDCVASYSNCLGSSATVPANTIIPAAAIGSNNYISVYWDPDQRANVYQIFGLTSINNGYYTYTGWTWAMSHLQAYAIDSKIDDGLPDSGKVRSRLANVGYGSGPDGVPAAGYEGPAGWGNCGNTDTTPATYNLIYEAYDSAVRHCSISIQFQ